MLDADNLNKRVEIGFIHLIPYLENELRLRAAQDYTLCFYAKLAHHLEELKHLRLQSNPYFCKELIDLKFLLLIMCYISDVAVSNPVFSYNS